MNRVPFDALDLSQLEERGIPVSEAIRELRLLEDPPPKPWLDRPCATGDGIETVSEPEIPSLLARHEAAAGAGRLLKFVPASGAASRMFEGLLGPSAAGGRSTARRILREARRFAFAPEIEAALAKRGDRLDRVVADADVAALLDALVGPGGLAYADWPKGVLPFHRYRDGSRTPFEEHLHEAAETVRDGRGACRVHLTVTADHLDRFRDLVDRVRPRWEERLSVRFDVSLSVQKPSTDTLAGDPEGGPFRDGAGRLVFRPAGHGALLENLADLRGDIVFIKNIDNVQPDRLRATTVRWKRILAGRLLEIEERAHGYARELEAGAGGRALAEEAARFVEKRLHVPLEAATAAPEPERRAAILSALDRPIRVCGVVRNTGEPGGGPFWVLDRLGRARPQIVEAAEVDRDLPDQAAILARSTHFNPVDLVCSVRDARGRPLDLRAFADPDAVIIARKSWGGRDLLALERPGLWNGAMAGWATVFVEVPIETFSPVKTVFDLLRPEHQPE